MAIKQSYSKNVYKNSRIKQIYFLVYKVCNDIQMKYAFLILCHSSIFSPFPLFPVFFFAIFKRISVGFHVQQGYESKIQNVYMTKMVYKKNYCILFRSFISADIFRCLTKMSQRVKFTTAIYFNRHNAKFGGMIYYRKYHNNNSSFYIKMYLS